MKKHKEKHNREGRTNKERAVDDKIRRLCIETPLENEKMKEKNNIQMGWETIE